MPKISVIIPTYNYDKYIEATIDSVLKQTYKDFEIIVIDDGSEDETKSIILQKYSNIVNYFFQNNRGASSARNVGISKSKGNHILFLDADDILNENTLFLFNVCSKNHPDSILYGPWIRYIEIEEVNKQVYTRKEFLGKDMLDGWLRGWYTASCSIFWTRNILDAIGGWDETLLANQDGDLAMRALIEGYDFHFCPEAWSYVRTHPRNEPSVSNIIDSPDVLNSRLHVVKKIEDSLRRRNIFNKYRKALSESYYILARQHVMTLPEISMVCYQNFRRLSRFGKPPGSYLNWIFLIMLGLERKEKLSNFIHSRLPSKLNQ